MRIDLLQEGNKEVDVEFNGKPISDVVWADDQAGECEVFERHYLTNELVRDDSRQWGYRSILLKGQVKIHDRRPKPSGTDQIDQFQYGGACWLLVTPGRHENPSAIEVFDHWDQFETVFLLNIPLSELGKQTMKLVDRLSVFKVVVDTTGIGDALYSWLNTQLSTKTHLYKK